MRLFCISFDMSQNDETGSMIKMNNDLISRSTLKAYARTILGGNNPTNTLFVRMFDEIIDNVPAVEKSKGSWKKVGEEYYNWSNHDVIKCSCCGYVKDVPDLKMSPHFCENCNADMRGKDKG